MRWKFLVVAGMLVSGSACAEGARMTAPPVGEPMPLALPFTPDEMRAALILILPADRVEREVRHLFGPEIGHIVSISDGTLLLLASVSEDAARRVIDYAPRLREKVEEIRADPAGWRYRVMHSARAH